MNSYDNYLMNQGNHHLLYEKLGSKILGDCVTFTLFAPNAQQVSVFGNFNNYRQDQYFLNKDEYGFFKISIYNINIGDHYQYSILGKDNICRIKSDPFAFEQAKDKSYSIISDIKPVINYKRQIYTQHRPLNIYEIHLAGYKHHWNDNKLYTYSDHLKTIEYIKQQNFNAIEFMPLNEHPCLSSWGYQPSNLFALTNRYGKPNQLQQLLEFSNQNDIITILDVVLGHFAIDTYSLENFDGTKLFEDKYNDLWGVYTFNYSSGFVRSYLKSLIHFLFSYYGFDGLRLDAINYIIYYDGNSNYPNHNAINFIKELNSMVKEQFANKIMIAEDSSLYPNITNENGLNFDLKWNLGWMNDTLNYFSQDPINRRHHFNKLIFSFHYMYTEKFILPISHDEVVHLKNSVLNKMPGVLCDKLLNLRMFLAHMIAHPGKKLLFMGTEFAALEEFNENRQLDWNLLNNHLHREYNEFCKRLNNLYQSETSLFANDFNTSGFKYLYDHVDDNVLVYSRQCNNERIIIILNTSGINHNNYYIPILSKNNTRLILNSNNNSLIDEFYANHDGGIHINLPRLSTLFLKEVN